MRILSLVAASTVALLLNGCASTDMIPGMAKSTSGADLATMLNGKTVTIAKREKPDFSAMTAGKAAIGGILGGGAMLIAGNKIIKDNAVADPAIGMARDVASAISSRHGAQIVQSSAGSVDELSVAEIIDANAGADFVLDVRTHNWGFMYFPTDWKHYRVNYIAKMRLINAATRSVVAKATCKRMPKKTGNEPTRDELLANNAAMLKASLQKAAASCTEEFKAKALGAS